MKTLPILTFAGIITAASVCAVLWLPGLNAQETPAAADPADPTAKETPATIGAGDPDVSSTPDGTPTAGSAKPVLRRNEKTGATPSLTLEDARERLINYRSLKADIVQTVRIGSRRFRIKGQYLHGGSDLKLRLEYDLQIGSTKAHLLEICDGQILRTHIKVGDTDRVTRRNVRQILDTASRSTDSSANLLNGELGLGGLRGLLASIQKSVQIDKQWEQDAASQTFVVVEGGWKSGFRKRFLGANADDLNASLPTYVPDKVRIYLEQESLFPRRILYLKRDASDVYHPMVSIDFVTVETNIDLPEEAFIFTPPKNVTQEDITESYVRQFTEPSTEKPTETPAEK